ncbi:uncharacterized protein LAESUDRAFT_721627 [Laetiporus sulphureus 93-53]|uniref:MYND-type domain-containing protein n=1 Tax=Laetiporus sulphureus 93-53 TaxID=1314785 RepID=A0A165GFR5_9APHY|nr:uncharacterized protein LAESUDRAFT_721627 [Laetiporus sulphureus 93-53]KZT10285.1 hypothetical protein LAESUDRAFT_721627 [Laetiporus sulphureus 93-53]
MPRKVVKRNGPTQVINRPNPLPEAVLNEIENAEGWASVVHILCDSFKLPDLTKRSGLKKIYLRFNETYNMLDDAYVKNAGNIKVTGGIVGIWAKMSADALLRDKLLKEAFVSKLVPLLDIPLTRYIVLQALSTVTHHGGLVARHEIAKLTPTLLRLLGEFPDDDALTELTTVIMFHAIGAVIGQEEDPDPQLLRRLDMRSVLKITTDNLRKPSASRLMINHAMGILNSATLHCHKECKALPSLVTFLVACVRGNDLITRCNALGGLIRLNYKESEPDMRFYDPQKMIAAVQRRFPDELVDNIMDYGLERCDMMVTLQSTKSFQHAMMEVVRTHDLYSLGHTLARLILRTEFSVADGMFEVQNERTGKLEKMDVGLPFTMWSDALPHCVRALRGRGGKADLDAADVVEMKHYIMKQRVSDSVQIGLKVIERNPQLAYAYYVIALGADTERGLRCAKKGLKCKETTPFVKNYLLWRAVEHAGNMGVTRLQEATAGSKDYTEGLAFLTSSQEDAKRFIAEAPPDSRNMGTILDWYIICTIALKGPELSADLHELNDYFKKVELADRFANFFGYPPKQTQMRLTRELIVSNYPAAMKSWGAVISRFDTMDLNTEPDAHGTPSSDKVFDGLAAWLDDLHVDDGPAVEQQRHCVHPRVSPNSVSLYRCSYCGNPSAVLRKCGGCGKTRYCDQSCQKSHWSEHKRACKANA